MAERKQLPPTEPTTEPAADPALGTAGDRTAEEPLDRVAERPLSAARLLGASLPGLAVAGGLGALGWLRNRYQHRRMFYPDRFPSGVWDPRPLGLDVEDRWFMAADGCRLHGWWIRRPRSRGALVYCHGNTGSIAHQVGVIGDLLRLRLDVLVFDYRGYGRSEGEPGEAGLYRDVRAAFDLVTGELGHRAEKVLLFGHSLGGAVAIDCALGRPAAGLVVQSSFTDMRSAARALYPDSTIARFARNHFRSIDKVGRLTLPKLFIHGTDDPKVPPAMGRALYEQAAGPKELFLVPGATHNDLHLVGGRPYFRRLAAFRDQALEAAATTTGEAGATAEAPAPPPIPPLPAGPARDPWGAARELVESALAAVRPALRRPGAPPGGG